MTEYEAYDMIMSIASNTFSVMFGYFSLVFGFLVMSHMAARKLTNKLAAVVMSLYTLATIVIVLNFYALNVDLDNLYLYLLDMKASDSSSLSWFGMNPAWVPKSLTIMQVLLGFGGYFGSLFFFYSSRRNKATA